MNYINTFIAVSPDTKAKVGSVPLARGGKRSIAQIEYELIANHPYEFTQEEVQFSVHVERAGVTPAELEAKRSELWSAFFSKSMACMRTSPLARSYGWGLHFDDEGIGCTRADGKPKIPRVVVQFLNRANSRDEEQTRMNKVRGSRPTRHSSGPSKAALLSSAKFIRWAASSTEHAGPHFY